MTDGIKAFYFDIFGTVTDWFTQIVTEGAVLSEQTGVPVPWEDFAIRWRRDGYMAALPKIAAGEMPYLPTEAINRRKLEELLAEYGLNALNEEQKAHFNSLWNRLPVWPDVPQGLAMLKERALILPFSNGDLRCLTEISANANLPWHAILSAEFFGKVKPDPTIYHDAAALMQLRPDQIMMVACHDMDLAAAARAGMRTAYIERPFEYGPHHPPEPLTQAYDIHAPDLIALANAIAL